MNQFDASNLTNAERHKLLLYHLPLIGVLTSAFFLFRFEFNVHLAITSHALIVEYLPKFTMFAAMIMCFSLFFVVGYFYIYFRPGEPAATYRWFWTVVIVLPILAGLGEYAAVQYRLNANNYERCYSISFGKRDYEPFYEEIVRKQIWLHKGGCKIGSWSDD